MLENRFFLATEVTLTLSGTIASFMQTVRIGAWSCAFRIIVLAGFDDGGQGPV